MPLAVPLLQPPLHHAKTSHEADCSIITSRGTEMQKHISSLYQVFTRPWHLMKS